ncbi:MAG TPA: GxxExxY protein [Vicinamibacterales bacterium]|nr:GxxExxY protein [Vicinamibacterales bacterium]
MKLAVTTDMFKPPSDMGDARTFAIIGAALEVHRVMGSGYLEKLYRQALAIELAERKIPFDTEVPCVIRYKGHQLSGEYYMHFVCYGDVVLEVKARSSTGPADQAQVLNYLASSDHSIALLLNFGTPRLEHKRFIWTRRAP